eukprot:gene4948-6921_t
MAPKKKAPTSYPTAVPTIVPTAYPSQDPTSSPTSTPTSYSTFVPTAAPTSNFCVSTGGAPLVPTKGGICAAYKSVKTQFLSYLATHNSTAQTSDFFGKAARLAFHDSAEVLVTDPNDIYGPDGCLSVSGDNAGLIEATSIIQTVFDPIWQSVCGQISRADFWVLMAKLAIETSEITGFLKIPYQYGRRDNAQCNGGAGRLPNPQPGVDEINRVFVNQMGLEYRDATTLFGAHTVGHVHTANSGYGFPTIASVKTNAWDTTPHIFDNGYYISMLNIGWRNIAINGPKKNLWKTGTNDVIMLNTDMVLGYPANTSNVVGFTGPLTPVPPQVNGEICRAFNSLTPAGYGCNGNTLSATPTVTKKPSTFYQVYGYILDQKLFFDDFAVAFPKMTCVGYGVPLNVDGATASGKLGTLTAIDLTTCPA